MKHFRKVTIFLFLAFTFCSYQEPGLTNEQKFFECIFQKYPNEYFVLTDIIHWENHYGKLYFVQVQPNDLVENRYLIEINDTVIKKYLPLTHFYTGLVNGYYEIYDGPKVFIGFLHKDTGDFALDTRTENGINKGLMNTIKGITIKGKEEKEKFCSSLLKILSDNHWESFNPNRMTWDKRYFKGSDSGRTLDKLTLTKNYNQQDSNSLNVLFQGDKLTDITLRGRNNSH